MNAVVDTAEENSTVAKVGEYMRAGDDDPDIRVIVLTGVRRGFCSGANLGSRASAGGLNRIIGGAGLGLPGIPQRKSGSPRTRCWREMDSNPLPFARNPAFLRLLEPRLQPICTPILHQFAPLRRCNPTTSERF